MSLSLDQVKTIQDQFVLDYMKDPYDVNAVGIGRDGNELCLRIHLRKPLPDGISIPAVYQGVKVIISGIGEIRAL